MINSAILLLLLLLSFEHAKKSRLENTQHQKTHNARKRKERNIPTKESTNTKYKISLSLSLSISFLLLSWCVSLFIQKFGREWTRGSQKTKNFAPPFLTVLSPLLRAPIQRELLPARIRTLITTKKKTTERKQKNERRIIISSLKSCLPCE